MLVSRRPAQAFPHPQANKPSVNAHRHNKSYRHFNFKSNHVDHPQQLGEWYFTGNARTNVQLKDSSSVIEVEFFAVCSTCQCRMQSDAHDASIATATTWWCLKMSSPVKICDGFRDWEPKEHKGARGARAVAPHRYL